MIDVVETDMVTEDVMAVIGTVIMEGAPHVEAHLSVEAPLHVEVLQDVVEAGILKTKTPMVTKEVGKISPPFKEVGRGAEEGLSLTPTKGGLQTMVVTLQKQNVSPRTKMVS